MSSSLFQFELQALENVPPWGEPEDPNLHWFGLTDGHYWIEAGGSKLFEYSNAVQSQFGVARFCDYQIVRLYEDVIDLAPYALEPVPEELRRYIAQDEAKPYDHYWTKWYETASAADAATETMELLDDAGTWLGRRALNSGYLTPSTNIVFWSDSDSVHIQWDNRDKRFRDCLAWSAQFGSWQLPRASFTDEVRSLHVRLMEQMERRVCEVEAGALPARIRIDLEQLRREQTARSQSFERKLANPPSTEWSPVIAAIRSLEAL